MLYFDSSSVHLVNWHYSSLNRKNHVKSCKKYVFGLARRGSTIGFHLLWHTVELAMSTRLCLL